MRDNEKDYIEQIEDTLQIPFPQFAEYCKDPDYLATLLCYAINMGIHLGMERTSNSYNKAFQGYTAETIRN